MRTFTDKDNITPYFMASTIRAWRDPKIRRALALDPRKVKRMMHHWGAPCPGSLSPGCGVCVAWGILLSTQQYPSFRRVCEYTEHHIRIMDESDNWLEIPTTNEEDGECTPITTP
jgi:hypothetical protein